MYRRANTRREHTMRATMRRKRKRSADRLTYDVEEAGVKLGIGRNQAYEAAKNGELPTPDWEAAVGPEGGARPHARRPCRRGLTRWPMGETARGPEPPEAGEV